MSEPITINLNDQVTIRLNAIGRRIINDYFGELGVPTPSSWTANTINLPLWELTNIFGPYLYNGCQVPFESMNVELRRMT